MHFGRCAQKVLIRNPSVNAKSRGDNYPIRIWDADMVTTSLLMFDREYSGAIFYILY